jgi:hypothetical protein
METGERGKLNSSAASCCRCGTHTVCPYHSVPCVTSIIIPIFWPLIDTSWNGFAHFGSWFIVIEARMLVSVHGTFRWKVTIAFKMLVCNMRIYILIFGARFITLLMKKFVVSALLPTWCLVSEVMQLDVKFWNVRLTTKSTVVDGKSWIHCAIVQK